MAAGDVASFPYGNHCKMETLNETQVSDPGPLSPKAKNQVNDPGTLSPLVDNF